MHTLKVVPHIHDLAQVLEHSRNILPSMALRVSDVVYLRFNLYRPGSVLERGARGFVEEINGEDVVVHFDGSQTRKQIARVCLDHAPGLVVQALGPCALNPKPRPQIPFSKFSFPNSFRTIMYNKKTNTVVSNTSFNEKKTYCTGE